MEPISGHQDDTVLIELTRHQSDLCAFVRALMPGDPNVDDVVQQTNLVVWRKRSSFKLGSDFRAWIFAIARLEVLGQRKTVARKAWLVIDDELAKRLAESMVTSTLDTPGGTLRRALDDCLALLKPAERALVDRFYHSGQSLKTIGDSGERSHGALKVALHRIRASLRRCIENQTRPLLDDLT